MQKRNPVSYSPQTS